MKRVKIISSNGWEWYTPLVGEIVEVYETVNEYGDYTMIYNDYNTGVRHGAGLKCHHYDGRPISPKHISEVIEGYPKDVVITVVPETHVWYFNMIGEVVSVLSHDNDDHYVVDKNSLPEDFSYSNYNIDEGSTLFIHFEDCIDLKQCGSDPVEDEDLLDKPLTRDYQIAGDHYCSHNIQPFDIIDEYDLDFYEGNALKYLLRHKVKNGEEDILKAIHYLNVILEKHYG